MHEIWWKVAPNSKNFPGLWSKVAPTRAKWEDDLSGIYIMIGVGARAWGRERESECGDRIRSLNWLCIRVCDIFFVVRAWKDNRK